MLTMFRPSAVSPPSANSSACTHSTTATQTARPGADQHGGEHAAQEVPAGAAGDREVQHLDGEDEGGDESGQRRLLFVERVRRLRRLTRPRPRPRRRRPRCRRR